jgi:hypothetical protein
MKRIPALLVLAAVVLAPTIASAACSDDVRELKARLQKEEQRDRTKAAALRQQLRPLDGPLKPGESECRNIVVRAWRVLNTTPVPVCPPPPGARYTQIEQCQMLQKKKQQ